MPRGERLASPSTCDTSDLISEIVAFVNENPDWSDDTELTTKLGIAINILVAICPVDRVTADEFEYIGNLRTTISERLL